MSDLTQATQPNAPAPPLAPETVRQRIDAMSPQQIELRRNEIIAAAAGDYESLSTEMLHEMAYIAKVLRRTHVGPPKEPKAKKTPLNIDDVI